ncbi:MAG: hypothetical protein IPK60_20445 [Sandaracinaceae bacterium]|nr:hypothetical protein [Sandaracinaceae bacterium]
MPIEFRQIAFTQIPQPCSHLWPALGQLREPRDQHVLAVRTVRQRDAANIRIDNTHEKLVHARRVECSEGIDEVVLALLEVRCIGRELVQEINCGIRSDLAESGDKLAQFIPP